MSNNWFGRITCLFLLTGATGTAGWGVRWSTSTGRSAWTALVSAEGTTDRLVEHAVVMLCSATLTLALVWLLVSVVVCSIDALRHRAGEPDADQVAAGTGGLFRPRLVRTLVSAAAGAAVATSSTAAGTTDPGGSPLPERLEGLMLPDRPYGGVRTHRVEAGESLWSITADVLPADAAGRVTDRAVSRAWPRLHRLNRDDIGPDPHLIHPGTTLRLPPWAPVPTRGATR